MKLDDSFSDSQQKGFIWLFYWVTRTRNRVNAMIWMSRNQQNYEGPNLELELSPLRNSFLIVSVYNCNMGAIKIVPFSRLM